MIFNFMGDHPVLTFFLALIIGDVIVKSVAAARGYYDKHCDSCQCDEIENNKRGV